MEGILLFMGYISFRFKLFVLCHCVKSLYTVVRKRDGEGKERRDLKQKVVGHGSFWLLFFKFEFCELYFLCYRSSFVWPVKSHYLVNFPLYRPNLLGSLFCSLYGQDSSHYN